MRTKMLALLAGSAVMLAGTATAAEKSGKPLDIKPSIHKQQTDNWRDRAMKARAEFAPDGTAPITGNARARDERGDRRDGDEAGGGRLRQDRGEGSGQEE